MLLRFSGFVGTALHIVATWLSLILSFPWLYSLNGTGNKKNGNQNPLLLAA